MRIARHVPQSTAWMRNTNERVPMWRTLAAIKTYAAAIPLRARMTRGRAGSAACREGCPQRETPNHVLQVCPSMREARCKRHNAVCALFAEYARRKGWNVWTETLIRTEEQAIRPDVIIKKDGITYVVEVAISTNSPAFPLRTLLNRKKSKYGTPVAMQAVRELTDATVVEVLPAILQWRGLWDAHAARGLRKIFPPFILEWAARRTLDGSGFIWAAFRRRHLSGAH